jgi:hypothetical protein
VRHAQRPGHTGRAHEVVWTIANPVTGDERAGLDVVLDAFHALPDHGQGIENVNTLSASMRA